MSHSGTLWRTNTGFCVFVGGSDTWPFCKRMHILMIPLLSSAAVQNQWMDVSVSIVWKSIRSPKRSLIALFSPIYYLFWNYFPSLVWPTKQGLWRISRDLLPYMFLSKINWNEATTQSIWMQENRSCGTRQREVWTQRFHLINCLEMFEDCTAVWFILFTVFSLFRKLHSAGVCPDTHSEQEILYSTHICTSTLCTQIYRNYLHLHL